MLFLQNFTKNDIKSLNFIMEIEIFREKYHYKISQYVIKSFKENNIEKIMKDSPKRDLVKGIGMFTILMLHFDENIHRLLKEVCSEIGHIRALENDQWRQDAISFGKEEINGFVFHLDEKILMDHERIARLLRFCGMQQEKIKAVASQHYRVSTAKKYYDIPYEDILFIESERKKSIVHTKQTNIELPIPLCQVKRELSDRLFIQTHRSFIVNLKNASYIDKTQEPWEISFTDSANKAFVSRSYRKEFMCCMTAFLKD